MSVLGTLSTHSDQLLRGKSCTTTCDLQSSRMVRSIQKNGSSFLGRHRLTSSDSTRSQSIARRNVVRGSVLVFLGSAAGEDRPRTPCWITLEKFAPRRSEDRRGAFHPFQALRAALRKSGRTVHRRHRGDVSKSKSDPYEP